MAIYVTSDAHGHLRALDRALELAAPDAQDEIYVLGDMVDRGPDPVGVIRLVRSLPNAHVLMGNHERMMLDVLGSSGGVDNFIWSLNGGVTTAMGLDGLSPDELAELVGWISSLPLFYVVSAADRLWILVHAGIDALEAQGYLASDGIDCSGNKGAGAATAEQLTAMLKRQDEETLLWTRAEFWGHPTGLVGADGTGAVVVAGHTPSIVLSHFVDLPAGVEATEDGMGCVVRLGACEDTGGVPDRIDIDSSAAAGAGQGRVGVMRLDDGAVWYAAIEEGE